MESEKRNGTGAKTAPRFSTRSLPSGRRLRTFPERMSRINTIMGDRYNAVKNELLAYKAVRGRKRVRSRITNSGETFRAGRKMLGKIRFVRGYLRLFLALDPKQFNFDKYHHKDYSEVACYARFPFMLKLSSNRKVKHALELIGILMKENGLEYDSAYAEQDYIPYFLQFAYEDEETEGADATLVAAMPEPETDDEVLDFDDEEIDEALDSDDEENDDEEAADESSELDMIAADSPDSAAGEETAMSAETTGGPRIADEAPQNFLPAFPLPAQPRGAGGYGGMDVRLPKRGKVVNRHGERIGKVRKSIWYDSGDVEQGTFVKDKANVYLCRGEERTAYLDNNGNVFTFSDDYLATIKRLGRFPLLIILLLLLLATALAFALSAYAIVNSGNTASDIPVLFFTDEEGKSWEETENLPVFRNEVFGDETIAPGMNGSYSFIFDNRNESRLIYSLSFSEDNFYGIDIRYRLKRDGAYVSGTDGYVHVGELGVGSLTIEQNSASVFELEWKWFDNDETDTAAGENNAVYTLNISLLAQADE